MATPSGNTLIARGRAMAAARAAAEKKAAADAARKAQARQDAAAEKKAAQANASKSAAPVSQRQVKTGGGRRTSTPPPAATQTAKEKQAAANAANSEANNAAKKASAADSQARLDKQAYDIAAPQRAAAAVVKARQDAAKAKKAALAPKAAPAAKAETDPFYMESEKMTYAPTPAKSAAPAKSTNKVMTKSSGKATVATPKLQSGLVGAAAKISAPAAPATKMVSKPNLAVRKKVEALDKKTVKKPTPGFWSFPPR